MDQSGLNLIELELSLNTLIDRAGIPQRAGCIYLQSAGTSSFVLVRQFFDTIDTLEHEWPSRGDRTPEAKPERASRPRRETASCLRLELTQQDPELAAGDAHFSQRASSVGID